MYQVWDERLNTIPVDSRARTHLQKWLHRIDLEKSNIIVIARLSRKFEENAISHIKEKILFKPTHFFAFHLSLDHMASLVLSEKEETRDFKDLASHQRLIFLHDIEEVSSIRKFIGRIRSSLERDANSTVVLTMRPAATYKVYQGTKAPLYGRVVKIEEPTLSELGIENKEAVECGFLDLHAAYRYDNFDKQRATKNNQSASFNALNLFWHFLTNDSQKAGSVRVAASCIAHHDEPLTVSEINKKCGIKHGRQTIHAALRTGLMKMTTDTPKKAYIYPPLLKSWIKTNIPFYPL